MNIKKVQYHGVHKVILRLCEAINALIEQKQDKLTFDSAPEKDSANPVTSGGLYDKLETLKASQVQIDGNGELYVTINGTKHKLKEGDDANA